MKTVAVIQARLNSSRLPEKILADLGGRSVLATICRRVASCSTIDEHVVACPVDDMTRIFHEIHFPNAVTGERTLRVFGGSEEDVLARVLMAAESKGADTVVRVTADCPLIDPYVLDRMVWISKKADVAPIVTNTWGRTFPNGMDAEVYPIEFLRSLSKDIPPEGRSNFYGWCMMNLGEHAFQSVRGDRDLSRYRMTLDYPEDLEVIRFLCREQGEEIWGCSDLVECLDRHPEIRNKNRAYWGEFGLDG